MRDRDGKGEGKEWRVGEAKWEGGEREGIHLPHCKFLDPPLSHIIRYRLHIVVKL